MSDAPGSTPAESPLLSLAGVSVLRDGRFLLREVDWTVFPRQRWVILGPNGAGKTTLLQVASTYLTPSRGTVRVLGGLHGGVDVRVLRERIGYAGAEPASLVRGHLPAEEIVVTGKYAAFVDSRWHDYSPEDWSRARHQLERIGASGLVGRVYSTLSAGEKQRVLIARSLMTDPELLLLDEATTGLDLGAREQLVASLGDLAADPESPAVLLVTHHVEEIPLGFTHILMLSGGKVIAKGMLEETLTAEALSDCFSTKLRLERREDRYRAWMPATATQGERVR